MTLRNGTRIAAAVAAAALVLPASALAAHRHHRHHVRSSVSLPKLTYVVPHIYDAGVNGSDPSTPPGLKFSLFDPVQIAQALGNQALGELGLPPLP